MNPLASAQGPMAGPSNPLMGGGPASPAPAMSQQVDPAEVAKGHEMADTMLKELMDLVQLPRGELTKEKVFKGAAGLMGKGLFDSPEARQQLVAQLTSLPSDEMALRQELGKEILQVAQFKHKLDELMPPQAEALNA